VEALLAELELDALPCLKVFNKIDRLPPEDQMQIQLSGEGVGISALDAGTLEPLLVRSQEILKRLPSLTGEDSLAERKGREGEGVQTS
jgi:GTP-binding protein HflX